MWVHLHNLWFNVHHNFLYLKIDKLCNRLIDYPVPVWRHWGLFRFENSAKCVDVCRAGESVAHRLTARRKAVEGSKGGRSSFLDNWIAAVRFHECILYLSTSTCLASALFASRLSYSSLYLFACRGPSCVYFVHLRNSRIKREESTKKGK